jgi:hypothetical protein
MLLQSAAAVAAAMHSLETVRLPRVILVDSNVVAQVFKVIRGV